MSTKPTIYVHIGAGKTGTSSIQTWLRKNETQLNELGYLLFSQDFMPNCDEGVMSNQQRYFHHIIKDEDGGMASFHSQLRENLEYMRANNFHSAIISAESIFVLVPQFAKWVIPFKDECNWKVIAYVRNQTQYLLSAWKEWGYWQYEFDEMIENNKYSRANWYEMLQPWEEAIGKEQMYVGIFDNTYLANKSILHDFAVACNIEQLITDNPITINSNPSLSNKSAIVLSNLRKYSTKRKSKKFTRPERTDYTTRSAYLADLRLYHQNMRVNFQLKQLVVQGAKSVSTHESDSSLFLATQEQLDYIYNFFNDSNKKLIEEYRPDVDINVAFPHFTVPEHTDYSQEELLYHGLHIQFKMLQQYNEQNINLKKIIHAQKKQLNVLDRKLHNKIQTIYSLTQNYDRSFAQIQQQLTEVNHAMTDLYARSNPIKYWLSRLWQKVTRGNHPR